MVRTIQILILSSFGIETRQCVENPPVRVYFCRQDFKKEKDSEGVGTARGTRCTAKTTKEYTSGCELATVPFRLT